MFSKKKNTIIICSYSLRIKMNTQSQIKLQDDSQIKSQEDTQVKSQEDTQVKSQEDSQIKSQDKSQDKSRDEIKTDGKMTKELKNEALIKSIVDAKRGVEIANFIKSDGFRKYTNEYMSKFLTFIADSKNNDNREINYMKEKIICAISQMFVTGKSAVITIKYICFRDLFLGLNISLESPIIISNDEFNTVKRHMIGNMTNNYNIIVCEYIECDLEIKYKDDFKECSFTFFPKQNENEINTELKLDSNAIKMFQDKSRANECELIIKEYFQSKEFKNSFTMMITKCIVSILNTDTNNEYRKNIIDAIVDVKDYPHNKKYVNISTYFFDKHVMPSIRIPESLNGSCDEIISIFKSQAKHELLSSLNFNEGDQDSKLLTIILDEGYKFRMCVKEYNKNNQFFRLCFSN
jgi:hypothetical protein